MNPLYLTLGAFSAFIAVGFGGARAHFLESRLPRERLPMLEVGMRYQVVHSLGLLFASIAAAQFDGIGPHVAAWMFVAGIVMFSGPMYCFALFDFRRTMKLTPIAGLFFLVGWLALAITPLLSAGTFHD